MRVQRKIESEGGLFGKKPLDQSMSNAFEMPKVQRMIKNKLGKQGNHR